MHQDLENIHRSALGESCVGRDAYRERLPGFLSAFKGLDSQVLDTGTDGDRVVGSYMLRAVHNGHPIEIPGMFDIVIVDGLIRRRIDYFDSLTFLRQTGQA